MQLYRLVRITDETVLKYHGTRDDAHEDAKGHAPAYECYRIELVDFPTDKTGLLGVLNSVVEGATDNITGIEILRTWALSNRGGLKEVANGE